MKIAEKTANSAVLILALVFGSKVSAAITDPHASLEATSVASVYDEDGVETGLTVNGQFRSKKPIPVSTVVDMALASIVDETLEGYQRPEQRYFDKITCTDDLQRQDDVRVTAINFDCDIIYHRFYTTPENN